MALTAPYLIQRSPYICVTCARQLCQIRARGAPVQRRSITENWLRKTADAAKEWALQSQQIRAGKQPSLLSVLEERGYVHQIAGDRDDLDRLMTDKRIGAYVGVDPTAPSLHVGHLVPLMSLFWLYVNGCHTITLLGGATARVGDPTDRATPRKEVASSVRKANMASIHVQLKKLWDNVEVYSRKYGYQWEWAWRRGLENNNAWLNKLGILEVLRLIGSGTRLGAMMGKETVRKKMESGNGMSLGEFLYPVLQSMDWWHMYNTKGIQIQIGGSDQFGNIIAGIETIKYINENHYNEDLRENPQHFLNTPMGFTVPLLTSASGEKFGKSAGNAIWLDQDMTSTFDLYQFFVRTADADVERYLKLFTFMPISMIKSIMDEHQTQPSMRIAQRKLAVEVLELIHGEKVAREAEAQHRVIFNPPPISAAVEKKLQQSNTADINPLLNPNAPHTSSANAPSPHLILPQSLIYGQPIARVLYAAGLVSSRSEGHRLVVKQGAYIGSRPGASGTMSDALEYSPAANWHPADTERYIIDGDLLILRVGKWKVKIVKIVPDVEFREKGLTAPGWDDDDNDHDVTFSPQKREDRRRWDQDTQPWRRKELFRRIVSPQR